MIDESCEVPREDLDEGFNPCRRQVVENGELCQYAHMYDVMNERYDREEDTSYLNSVKRDRINQATPSQSTGGGKLYSQDANGLEGYITMAGVLEPTTNSQIPSSKAVADYVTANIPDISELETLIDGKLDKVISAAGVVRSYAVDANGNQIMRNINGDSSNIATGHIDIPTAGAVADYAPIPLPISKGGTGGNTPYVTDDLDESAIFVMHDAPNDRYDAAPMSALTNYLATQFMSFDNEAIPDGADLNTYQKPGNYATRTGGIVPTIINAPNNVSEAFNLYVVPTLNGSSFISQYLVEYISGNTYYRDYRVSSAKWNPWKLLYPTSAPTVPNPLPVDQGGTGAQTRSLKTAAGLTLLPVIDSIGASGALNGYTSVTNIATFITTNNIRPEITAAFENHTADAVADNDLLPTNALMIDYVNAHSLATPPSNFSFKVSPSPAGDWEGEMNVNVSPVFSTTIGAVTYIMARVYGSNKFNYTGTADNITFFSGLNATEYPYIFSGGTNIPIKLNIQGRSYTSGTYGFAPRGSGSGVLLNDQIVSSVFSSGNLNMSNNLNCVFGDGANTPGVWVSFNCLALMWRSVS